MEYICKRFPALAEDVIEKIDLHSLTNFKEASREGSDCLNNGRVLWKQTILEKISGKDLFSGENISPKKHNLSLHNQKLFPKSDSKVEYPPESFLFFVANKELFHDSKYYDQKSL